MRMRFFLPRLVGAAALAVAAGHLAAAPTNLAPMGAVTGSSEGYGSVFRDAADDNRDGNFANGSVWHTAIPDTAPWIEVDLGADRYLDRVMLWPRTDVSQGTVENFTIKVLNAANTVVWSADYFPASAVSWAWGTSAMRGVVGRKVRYEKKDSSPNFLTFAELEVWGDTNPPTANYARAAGATVTASAAGFGTLAGAAVDGDLNANYASVASPRPIYHSTAAAVGNFWQVDLGVDRQIDYAIIYCRQDSNTTDQVRLKFLNAAGTEVHSGTVSLLASNLVKGGARFDVTYDVPGVITARTVRIETLAAQYLALAEVEIFGQSADITPPVVTRKYPDQGALVAELTSMEVQFSETVVGVTAGDLLVNGLPATSVTSLGGGSYLFSFPQPANGPVTLGFAAGHGIADAAANPFAGASWSVTLDDSLPAPLPVITEIMADNKGGLEDEFGASPDWIEIYNPGPTAVNLAGWWLTDDLAVAKWHFGSPTLLEAGQYLVVFASGLGSGPDPVPDHPLHASFKLDPDGESVYLLKPDFTTVVSQIASYPAQRQNVSYGRGLSYDATPLLAAGSPARVLIPTGAVAGWTAPEFNDAGWLAGTLGVGFDQSGGQGPSGPMGWWNFDNATNAAQALDVSGNGRHGTVTNATYSADGLGRTGLAGDRAMVFAGNGAVSISSAATGAFDAMVAQNAVTVSLWIYGAPEMPVGNFTFYGATDAAGANRNIDAHLPWSDSVIYWDTAGCCDTGQTRIFIGEPNPARWRDQWNHYAFVKDGDQKEIWQNGLLLHSGTNVTPLPAMRYFVIGAQNAAGANGYRGRMDDFAIWDGALAGNQIAALAAGASPASVRLLTPLVSTDIGSAMRGTNASAYVRVPFHVANPAGIDQMVLKMRYDDGFVAWLNGIEVARRNAPTAVAAASAALGGRPAGAPLVEEKIDLARYAALLRTGANVLAIQGLNQAASDGTFLVLPELSIGHSTPDRYFPLPTPGAPNDAGYTGFVGDVHFSPQRGFYDAPVIVTLTCATPGATLVYTTDGSVPTLINGTSGPSPLTASIAGTTTLRATAFSGNLAPTNVDTHTYLYVDQVAGQQRPASAPVAWPGGSPADFAMDPRVPGANPPAGRTLRDALLAIPTLSLTSDPAGLWGANGIYAVPSGRGRAYERFTAAEWLDPAGGDDFHVNGGLRIHGNISRDKGFTPKHGFSLRFRSDYGDTKLKFPLFPGSTVDEFDELVLRAGSTDTFPCTEWSAVGLGLNGELYQRWNRDWASYLRDQWVRDTHIAMGHADFHGRFCHLYLNGSYWGLYNIAESPSASHFAEHLGGDEAVWDTVADFSELHEGTRTAWDQLLLAANSGTLDTDAGLRTVQGLNADGTPSTTLPVLLNVDSLIDYMILHIYIGADDWPNHNWWGARRSRDVNDGFRFFCWDQEISNENVAYGKSSWGVVYAEANADGTPTRIYSRLRNSPEFRLRFADRINRHLFNGGPLSQLKNLQRWNARVAEIDAAIVAESSRWGDAQANHTNPGQPYTRENAWLPHLTWMNTNYWPAIPATALQRYRSANLYPSIDAPQLTPFGGLVSPGFSATLANPNGSGGTLVWTTDGSDPRQWGGAAATSAQTSPQANVTLSLTANVTVKARVLQGATWSALTEVSFPLNRDLDNDGLADDWESAHGLSSSNQADADLDSDRDGQSNRAEYAANTDPQDPASVFSLESHSMSQDTQSVVIEFTRQPGRTYRVERSSSLSNGSWSVRKSYAATDIATAVQFTEAMPATRHFYRVVAIAPAPNG